MVLAIICFVLGVFSAINGFGVKPTGAPQQTVQYLMFVCSSVFFVGGFLLLKLHTLFGPKKQPKDTSSQKESEN